MRGPKIFWCIGPHVAIALYVETHVMLPLGASFIALAHSRASLLSFNRPQKSTKFTTEHRPPVYRCHSSLSLNLELLRHTCTHHPGIITHCFINFLLTINSLLIKADTERQTGIVQSNKQPHKLVTGVYSNLSEWQTQLNKYSLTGFMG